MDRLVTERLGSIIRWPSTSAHRHVLTDLSNANASSQTIRAYRGYLIGFAAPHDGEIGELTAAPVRAYLAEIVAGERATSNWAARVVRRGQTMGEKRPKYTNGVTLT